MLIWAYQSPSTEEKGAIYYSYDTVVQS